jgi:threonine 3-dehydrogenase
MKEGFDVGLEMSGNITAFNDLLHAMNYGGQVALLGIPAGEVSLDLTQIILKGLKIKGIYGREMFETWYKMTSMLQSNLDISPVITHRFGVEDFQQAFEVMRSGQSGKVIMDWKQ